MKIVAVIMAGGKGERFWPKSRSNLPKQFLSLTESGKTMIQMTFERHLEMVSSKDVFVVTNAAYTDLVSEQLPDIPPENILAEPVARNTAPCIGYAAAIIRRKYKDAVMMVLASDHLVHFNEMYLDTMSQAVQLAESGENLITIGITPTYPETGYGYIQFGRDETSHSQPGVYTVKRFVEKPDVEQAREYLKSGQYLWNSGMFVWKSSTILNTFKQFLPDTYRGLEKIEKAYNTENYSQILSDTYHAFQSESIDYGIMEKASHIYTIPGNFGWDDVGSWLALERINRSNEDGNTVQGDVITIGTKNSIIIGGKKLVAAVGLEDIVIVDADDAILICDKYSAQNVKKVIENLRICNRHELI